MMAAPPSKPGQGTKPATPSTATGNASARLEKSNPGVRRSTPDSEALASSDDDGEHAQLASISTNMPAPKPARRTSWLNEVPAPMPRKSSLTSVPPLSSGTSNPTSPATEQSPWAASSNAGMGSTIAWNHGGSSLPWGTGIWNTESRKEPPPRLSEIVPSPTMSNPSANNYFAEELLSPTTRTTSGDSSIPFSIPLHPTPKTYRSQSYSVGQLDPEFLNLMANKSSAQYPGSRTRSSGQFSALQHRGSRPSLLGELGHDPATLGRVREDDDDDGGGSPSGSDRSSDNYASSQARTIEQLARENALLRQAAGQMDNSLRDRTMSSASATSGYAVGSGPGAHNVHRIHGSVPEETNLAVEDLDELGDIPGYNNIHSNSRRRFSEHSANLERQFPTFAPLDNRALDNVRKAHWQTSLGFDSMADFPQSRRHSFADIPIRNTSISGESPGARGGLGDRDDGYARIGENPLAGVSGQNREYQRVQMTPRPEEREMEMEYLRARRFAESYFADPALRAADGPSAVPTSLHQAYAMPGAFGRHPSGLGHPHHNQLLYIVSFKCHRADVFYIQEDTGFKVNPGDLVIVEADRGTDLGTVQHANISMQRARELKQQYAEEHYKCLMMFSRHGQNGASNVASAPGGPAGVNNRSAIGGMGPHGPHGVQEPAADIKPKLIKRLAQSHEVMSLRDKEGNEAKAKRVCQQKVAEHRLNMEILDAEFQMDWKKLTFYYFADSYINFNSLVTDLFKIYKTRIWMSAINPASFVTPPSGLQPNPLYNPDATADRPSYDRGYSQSREGLDAGRDTVPNPMDLLRNAYTDSYQPFGQTSRQPESGLGAFSTGDHFPSYPSTGYGLEGYNDLTANGGPSRFPPTPGDWVNRFQGLSLGS